MAIIKILSSDCENSIYLNTKHIESFLDTENKTVIYSISGQRYFVKETPEEILALIKEAETNDFSQKSKIFSRALRI